MGRAIVLSPSVLKQVWAIGLFGEAGRVFPAMQSGGGALFKRFGGHPIQVQANLI
jgi:hypothetical protein